MGLGKKLHQIYTIDYATATPYSSFPDLTSEQGGEKKHLPDNTDYADQIIGTSKFASLNVLQGHKPSRRDDLESIGLILIYFLNGSLPWEDFDS